MTLPTFADARTALQQHETSCTALVSSFLETIHAQNDALNAFVVVHDEAAFAQAKAVDAQLADGAHLPLAGMVMGLKDVLCVKGEQVSCGSKILQGFESLFDGTAIGKLRDAGVVFVGTTNCDEFAMGSSNENSVYGPARNPANPEYVTGGSSGGSAAAVAAGMCHTSLGTDTGGSVRQPAAFCGTVGLKPTYGRVSRYGLVAYASSCDVIGPFGHTVADIADVLHVIAGHDPADATSANVPVPDYRAALGQSVAGLKIGLPDEYFGDGLDEHIRIAIDEQVKALEAAGASIHRVSLPHTSYGIATYYIITTAEASSNLARYDGIRYGYRADLGEVRESLAKERRQLEHALTQAESSGDPMACGMIQKQLDQQDSLLHRLYTDTRTQGFGSEVKRRIMLGTYVLSSGYYDAYYAKAQRVRRLIKQDYERAFEHVDVLLAPATPTPAFKIGSIVDDPLTMYLNDIYTVTANLAGVPGLVVPIGTHPSGLPMGLQLLGPHFGEERLLTVGQQLMNG
ncbi:MAG: amidase family protein [Rhodothermales bacterium]